jgi:alpha-galactosidase
MVRSCHIALFAVLLVIGGRTAAQVATRTVTPETGIAAPTPPMGWNSYDYFGAAVTEAEFRSEAEFMKEHLLEYGWIYAVIDYLWFNPTGGTSVHPDANGAPRDTLAMDAFGRLLPALNRFPSAAGGAGFTPIADEVHRLGLRFGIHIMRGIPRQAWWENRPILGSTYRARDIADTVTAALCRWNNNMYRVRSDAPGGQAYYNSLIDLYASWGVDFLKVDDIAAPPYREDEIEMIRKAIDRCGRPMVLSLSPGETPIAVASTVARQANMWRIADDMWDEWKLLLHQFELLERWYPSIGVNHWPDADMLALGHLSRNGKVSGPDRMSRFTTDETYTLLSLWAIARSPLIMGGDLLTSPPEVIALLQNREVIELDQRSRNNRQVFRDSSTAVWMAEGPAPGVRYLALFNLEARPRAVEYALTGFPGSDGDFTIRDIWVHKDLGSVRGRVKTDLGAHGAALFKLMTPQ